jgi:hypothetical protein
MLRITGELRGRLRRELCAVGAIVHMYAFAGGPMILSIFWRDAQAAIVVWGGPDRRSGRAGVFG